MHQIHHQSPYKISKKITDDSGQINMSQFTKRIFKKQKSLLFGFETPYMLPSMFPAETIWQLSVLRQRLTIFVINCFSAVNLPFVNQVKSVLTVRPRVLRIDWQKLHLQMTPAPSFSKIADWWEKLKNMGYITMWVLFYAKLGTLRNTTQLESNFKLLNLASSCFIGISIKLWFHTFQLSFDAWLVTVV